MIIYFVVRLVPAWPMINAVVHVRGALIVVQCFCCVALVWISNVRTEVWRSEVVFWKDSLEKGPKARVLHNYALSLLEHRQVDEAIEHFYKAIERDDCYASPHAQLASIYHTQGNRDKAQYHQECALEIGGESFKLFDKSVKTKDLKKSTNLLGYCYHAEESSNQPVDDQIEQTI